jgi:hypothetical protein
VSLTSLTRRVLACLEAHGIGVDALYLFGSHARGEGTRDSDIDLLVVSPHFAARDFWQRCSLVGKALGGLPDAAQVYPVTPGEFDNPEPGGFLEAIAPDLQLLYWRPRSRDEAGKLPARKKRPAGRAKRSR